MTKITGSRFDQKNKKRLDPEIALVYGPPGVISGKEKASGGYSFQELYGRKAVSMITLGVIGLSAIAGVLQIDTDNGVIHISGPQLDVGDDASGHTMYKGSDGVANTHGLNQPSIGRAVHDEKTVISARDEGDEPVAVHPKRIRAGKSRGLGAPPMQPLNGSAMNSHQQMEKDFSEPLPGCPITYLIEPNPNPGNLPSENFDLLTITIDNATEDYDATSLAIEYLNKLKENGQPLPYGATSERDNVLTLRNLFYDRLNHPLSGEGYQDGKIIIKFGIMVENGQQIPVSGNLRFDKSSLEAAIVKYNEDCKANKLPTIDDVPSSTEEIAEQEEAAARALEANEEKSKQEKAFEEWMGESASAAKENYWASAAIVAVIAGLIGYLAGSKKSS